MRYYFTAVRGTGSMQIFFGVLAFIAIGAGFPILYMWSAGKFVGQRPTPRAAKAATLGIATLGIGYSALLAVQQVDFSRLESLAIAALLTESGITGVVALQESFEDAPKGPTE
jgi:hypothetical protein